MRAGIDAGLIRPISVGNGVRRTHEHAFPSRGVSKIPLSAILNARVGQIISPAAWRTLIEAKSCCIFSKSVFFNSIENNIEETGLMTDSGIIVPVCQIGTFSNTFICCIITI